MVSKKTRRLLESASELYRQSDHRLSAKLVPAIADRGCHVVSVTDPYGRILGFLDRNRYFFFQAAPQLYSRGWVDPVPDPLLVRTSGGAENRTRTSRSADHRGGLFPEFFLYLYAHTLFDRGYIYEDNIDREMWFGFEIKKNPRLNLTWMRRVYMILRTGPSVVELTDHNVRWNVTATSAQLPFSVCRSWSPIKRNMCVI
jgi:hypothetical protein